MLRALFKNYIPKRKITQNQPTGTDDLVFIEDIIIPDEFQKSRTGYNKIRWAKEYYLRNGHFDKPISVFVEINEKRMPNILLLIDEYSRYIAAKQLGLTHSIPVKYIKY